MGSHTQACGVLPGVILITWATLPESPRAYAWGDKPPALVAAEEARDSAWLRTARIEFRRDWLGSSDTTSPPACHYFTWRCAGDTYITVDQGDQDGVVMRDADGRPRDDLPYHGPMNFLVRGNEIWMHVEDAPTVEVWAAERQSFFKLHDLRKEGLDPVADGADPEERLRALGYPPPDYESFEENGLIVVTARARGGELRWLIDPDKDWNIVRTGVWVNGKQIGDTRYTLAQYDGVWFPQRMERYRLGAGDVAPSTVVTVLSAEFNRPNHPQELTPPDIGIEAGATIIFEDPGLYAPNSLMWDGRKPVLAAEFIERLEKGELHRGPTIQREFERAKAELKAAAAGQSATTRPVHFEAALDPQNFESQWERYTRRFIVRYRLDDEQARKAWTICRECDERGRKYVAGRRSDFEEWQGRRDALNKATPEDREKQSPRVHERRAELMQPVERIFEDRLKPALDQLPTPAQRSGATTRPDGPKNAQAGG
jgi:hypothetical protein